MQDFEFSSGEEMCRVLAVVCISHMTTVGDDPSSERQPETEVENDTSAQIDRIKPVNGLPRLSLNAPAKLKQ